MLSNLIVSIEAVAPMFIIIFLGVLIRKQESSLPMKPKNSIN